MPFTHVPIDPFDVAVGLDMDDCDMCGAPIEDGSPRACNRFGEIACQTCYDRARLGRVNLGHPEFGRRPLFFCWGCGQVDSCFCHQEFAQLGVPDWVYEAMGAFNPDWASEAHEFEETGRLPG